MSSSVPELPSDRWSPLRQTLERVRSAGSVDPETLIDAFSTWCTEAGITPYPHQEEALLELAAGAHTVLATPTGSGKSLVATGAHFMATARGERSYYTAPIKALVSEKFFALCEAFGADLVGMSTGDAAVNPDAPIMCCTAEILAIQALRQGASLDVQTVIMDEFHYYGEADRGWAWQVPLLELPNCQFLLMSATLGDTQRLRDDLTERTNRPVSLVDNAERPIPLHHYYAMTPLVETIEDLVTTAQAPVYIVHFSQLSAIEQAQQLLTAKLVSNHDKAQIAEALGQFKFGAGFGKVLSKLVRAGIGVHHAGMLPKYRRLVETLAQRGLLRVICGTDTLGVGINVPIRTVLLTSLVKFDGKRSRHLSVREFHQIAGRAGRAGFDTAGTVVVQAPEWEIENARLVAKAGDDPRKLRKLTKKKPPEGTLGWTDKTHDRLVNGQAEALNPSLVMNHGVVLHVIQRPGNAFNTMRRLLRENHCPRKAQNRLILQAIRIYRSLLESGVVERLDQPDDEGRVVRLNVDVPANFALNQPLSAYAVAALDLFDAEDPEYALNVISAFEATLDDPNQVLYAQQKRARGDAVAAMKADGIPYEERMSQLEEVTWPKPLEELLQAGLDAYQMTNPWVLGYELKPKSIVREMWQRAMTFNEFVSHFQLARSEGVLLRYLTDAYRTLRNSVPTSARNDELDLIIEWLGAIVRQTDSSLLDEWSDLAAGHSIADDVAIVERPEPTLTENVRVFTAMVRNAMFRRVELLAWERYEELGELDAASGWHADAWYDATGDYFDEYDEILTDATARNPKQLVITPVDGVWELRQILTDPDGNHDWGIEATCDLAASDEAGSPVIQVTYVGPHRLT